MRMLNSQQVAAEIAKMLNLPTDGLTKIELYCDTESFLTAKCEYEILDKNADEIESRFKYISKQYEIKAELKER